MNCLFRKRGTDFVMENRMKYKILVVDDERNICFTLKRFLEDEGYKVFVAEGYWDAMDLLADQVPDLVFADIMLVDGSGMDLLNEINRKKFNCPVVMITGVPTIQTAAEAVRHGAFYYLSKPVRQKDLIRVAATALKHKAVVEEKERLQTNLKAIFKSVQDGIITIDRQFNVIEINQAAQKLCGLTRETTLGRSLESRTESHCEHCINLLKKTIEQKSPNWTRLQTCRRNTSFEQMVSLKATPLINNAGSLSGAVLVIRDETRLVALEKNLKERSAFYNIVGKSEKMQNIYTSIDNLADVRTTVLVTGESGTGKELVGEALHYRSVFSEKPLIKVNCGTIAENLLESELFGHVKGSFSGAITDRTGRFQVANGGTILLDEIGDITPKMQLALLRVLQEKEFERVGSSTPIKVDVRIVAATNLDLLKEVEAGRFRQDLYYRLQVVEITIPPLREHKEDIPLLVEHFLNHFNKEMNKNILNISQAVKDIFFRHNWAGNIRELKNVMEHSVIFCPGSIIHPEHLPSRVADFFQNSRQEIQKREIIDALEKFRWNKTKAADELGMSRQNLYRKLKEHNIDK